MSRNQQFNPLWNVVVAKLATPSVELLLLILLALLQSAAAAASVRKSSVDRHRVHSSSALRISETSASLSWLRSWRWKLFALLSYFLVSTEIVEYLVMRPAKAWGFIFLLGCTLKWQNGRFVIWICQPLHYHICPYEISDEIDQPT